MLPRDLQKICKAAFSNCPELKTVTIPSTAKVERGAFKTTCKKKAKK